MSVHEVVERRISGAPNNTFQSYSRASSLQKITGPERKKYSSLFVFSETNRFRNLCRLISESKVIVYLFLHSSCFWVMMVCAKSSPHLARHRLSTLCEQYLSLLLLFEFDLSSVFGISFDDYSFCKNLNKDSKS